MVKVMRNIGIRVLGLTLAVGIVSTAQSAFAFRNNLQNMFSQSNCQNCHPANNPVTPAALAFSVIDPVTQTQVDRYEVNKDYILRVRFTPVSGAAPYVVGYKMEIYNSQSQPTGTITDPPLGSVVGGINDPDRRYIPAPNQIARIINSTAAAGAQEVNLNWRAPSNGNSAVIFNLWRLETNANNAQGGDRGSSAAETFSLLRPDGAAPPPPNVDSDDDSSSSTSVASTGNGFGGDLSGGCGTLKVNSSQSPLVMTLAFIFMSGILFVLRRRSA